MGGVEVSDLLPEGKTYAGDTPPADSKVKGEYTSSDALREREAELLGKIGGARRAFGELTEMVARTHGGFAPPSWASMRCDGCP